MRERCYLVLENGKTFEGKPFGARKGAVAEIVFATGMTGYLETLTDKSYMGQAVIQTFPLIGNYGVIPDDFESASIGPAAYIVKEWCRNPSNFRSQGDIDTFLKDRDIPGLYDIDTRSLTKIIREHGVMNGAITEDPDSVDMEALRQYKVRGVVAAASTRKPYTVNEGAPGKHVALMDFGLKENIKRKLIRLGCQVTVVPCDMPVQDILALGTDGVMLSNGPGDPADNPMVIENLRELSKSGIPIFGICLGHQLLALASGFETTKLKYGHRGANQPARDLNTGRVYITSQNHGYAVVSESIQGCGREFFKNVNDGSCEGIEYTSFPGFSVQFHPEACGGPQDTSFLFDRFMNMMEVR